MKKTRQFNFTKAELLKWQDRIPNGQRSIEVQDLQVKALRCRISETGRMTMFLDKKVGRKHVKRSLGEYLPGKGGNTVEGFRTRALAELVKIGADPQQWLEGQKPKVAEEITIADAFDLALKASNRGEMATRDWNESKARFITWLKANHPHIQTWARLRRQHVREYLDDQRPTKKSIERGVAELSATRKRLLMQPLTQTSRYMWLEHEIPNCAERMGLSARLNKTPAPVYLQDVLAFLNHLRATNTGVALEAGAALAGLAGLQLMEVLRLTWSKVDFSRGLIEISGETKNRYRNRVIPVPARCLDALKRARSMRQIEGVEEIDGGRVVTSPAGTPFEGKNWQNYSLRLKAEIRAWNSRIDWAPKDLRNCIMTLAALRGFSGDLLEQFVGHAPKSVTARNYIPRLSSASIGEAAELENAMETFRQLVVEPIEREIHAIEDRQIAKVIESTKEGGED